MSRLFSPFDLTSGFRQQRSPLEQLLAGNPFAGVLPATREPTVSQLLPAVDPAEEQSELGGIMEGGLGGLAYIGKLADKTFGGRAIRGLLGGRPQEALSILPFSDTLGITQEGDTVSGRSLLQGAGLIGAGDPNELDTGDVAGFLAEVALDPSTYLGFGPLTRAGSLAKKAGGLPRTGAQRAAGFTARESDLALDPMVQAGLLRPSDILRQGGRGDGAIMSPSVERLGQEAAGRVTYTDPLTGMQHSTPKPNVIQPELVFDPLSGGMIPNPNEPSALAGLLGIGLPFSRPSAVLGEGRRLASLPGIAPALRGLGQVDAAIGGATGITPSKTAAAVADPVVRTLRGVFGPSYQGTYDARAQEIARDVITPALAGRDIASMEQWVDHLDKIKPFLGRSPEADRAAMRGITSQAEYLGAKGVPFMGFGKTMDYTNKINAEVAKYFTPAEAQSLEKIGEEGFKLLQDVRGRAAALGVNEPELLDDYISYFTRQKTALPRKKGESIFDFRTRQHKAFAADHASQIMRDPVFRNMPGGTAQINDLSRDKRLSGAAREINGNPTTDGQAIDILLEELTGTRNIPKMIPNVNKPGKEMINPIWRQARKLNDWLKKLEPEYATDGVDFFSMDVPANVLTRLRRADRAMTAADAVLEGVTRFGRDKATIEAQGDQAVLVKDVLKMFGLTGREPGGGKIAPGILSNRMGVGATQIMKDTYVPARMVEDLRRVNEAWSNPRALSPVVQAWDWATNLFKGFVTAPFPAFHTRNLVSGIFNHWRGGVMSSPKEYTQYGTDMWNLLRGHALPGALPGMATGADATQEFLKEAISRRVAFTPGTTNTADVVGSAGEAVIRQPDVPRNTGRTKTQELKEFAKGFVPKTKEQANPLNIQGVNRDEDVFTVMKQARDAGKVIENWIRLTHYYGLRKQGWLPDAASMEVKKYQLDYRDLSPTEKDVMKRIYPWYAFSRRNLPPLLEDLAEQPAKITAALRLTTGVREHGQFIPNYVAEGASLPIPGGPEGSQRYLTSFGLPVEDELVKTIGSLAQGNLTRAAQQGLGMAQPFIKAPAEFTFNKQLYTGRPLEDLRPYEYSTLGGLLDDRQGRIATQVVANTPFSRAASTVNRLADSELIGGRKGVGSQLINLLTGARISDVDVEKARDAATKEVIGNMLRGQPGVKTTSDVYLPKEKIPEGDPRNLLLYRLYLNADQRIRDRAAERRQAAGP